MALTAVCEAVSGRGPPRCQRRIVSQDCGAVDLLPQDVLFAGIVGSTGRGCLPGHRRAPPRQGGQIEGLCADRTVGLDGVRSEIAMMRTPDGHGKLELTRYHTPAAARGEPENPPPNTLGLHRVMFAVDDIHDTVARLRVHGAELLGEVAQYESIFLLCYLRGPAGIIVALAEQIG